MYSSARAIDEHAAASIIMSKARRCSGAHSSMPTQTRIVSPGPDGRSVRTADGQVLRAPADWVLVPPGDAGLTRRVKAAGATWTVQERRGRKTFSRGVWADGAVVERI